MVPEDEAMVKQLTGQALANATVNIIDPDIGEVIATTTTDENGNYEVNVPAGGPYILQAEKDGIVIQQITPKVEAGEEYDLDTADETTTAVVLLAQAMLEAEDYPDDLSGIDLEAIEDNPNFADILAAVQQALLDGEDPAQSAEVIAAVWNFLYPVEPTPPAPTPTTPTYTITATAGTGGSIEPEGSIKVKKGNSRAFTITPDEGYQITDVLVDGESVGSVVSYTFTNVQKNHTIHASFSDGVFEPEWLGDPQCIPDTIFTLQSTDVRFHILVNKEPDDLASESPVKLFMKDGNTSWVLLDEMFDDGDLDNHGDEIKGDRTYSNIIEFYEEHSKDIPLKIVVTTSDNQQYSVEFSLRVVEDLREQIIMETDELSYLAEEKVIEIMQSPPPDLSGVIQILSDYLAEQSYVERCEIFGNIIEVTFGTGVLMEIQLINLDAGEPPTGMDLTGIEEKLKQSNYKNRQEEYIPIPLENQTTGGSGFIDILSKNTNDYLGFKDVSGVEYIGNRNVFVYAPDYTYRTYWGYDIGSEYIQLLGNSGIDFNIKMYRDEQADIDALKKMIDYGIVILHAHGGSCRETLVTGEEPDIWSSITYLWKMITGEIFIANKIGVSWSGDVQVYSKKYGVTKKWLNSSNLSGEFPNSIIFSNCCHSTRYNWYDAFESLGAATYYGHSDLSWLSKNIPWTIEVLEGLIEGKTTGEAYVERLHNWEWDDRTGTTYWQMQGKENVKIPVSIPFSNGGFEDGFSKWQKEGDGRIISALAFLKPTEGSKMAIISTGLGYTDKYGSIFQTFTVGNNDTTLEFDWNYLSEEFLEFIGSIFQDPFKVSLTKVDDASTTTLLYKTVDSIAADFGATQEFGGDLIYVISAFQGNTVTIKFEAEDLGDEIYDTAILLDNIKIY